MFTLCIIAGLTVGLSLGWAVKANGNYCPLYAQISITPQIDNKSVQINQVGDMHFFVLFSHFKIGLNRAKIKAKVNVHTYLTLVGAYGRADVPQTENIPVCFYPICSLIT